MSIYKADVRERVRVLLDDCFSRIGLYALKDIVKSFNDSPDVSCPVDL